MDWKIEYVPGSVNEYRIWDKDGNYVRPADEQGGQDRAAEINLALAQSDKEHSTEPLATDTPLEQTKMQDAPVNKHALGQAKEAATLLLSERDLLRSQRDELREALEGFVALVDTAHAIGDRTKADGVLMTKTRAILARVRGDESKEGKS